MALPLQLGGQELRDKRHPTCHYMGSDVEDMEPRAAQAHPGHKGTGLLQKLRSLLHRLRERLSSSSS